MHKDTLGNVIAVGAIVAFVDKGYEGLPPLSIGKVVSLTKAGVTVQYLNPDYTPKRGSLYNKVDRRWIDGAELPPENIRLYDNRFVVLHMP